uniref:Lipocalin n=1 Tax=Amblyomma americanum TaxID=6943 RepID=A0A0C9SE06_AMBAM
MNSFTVVILLTLSVMTLATSHNLETLQKALGKNQRIWTTIRSYERHTGDQKHECVYAWKTYMDDYKYKFDQYYKYGTDTWASHPLQATLSPGAHGALLTVSQPTGTTETPYTLVYWNEGKNCGILRFHNSTSEEDECELHVGDSEVQQNGKTHREHEYDTYCEGKKKYFVYESGCWSHSP